MADFGNFAIAIALTFCAFALFSLFYGARTGRRELVKSGERAVLAVFAFTTLAVVALEVLLLRSDFSIEYVASYSNRDLPIFYKMASLWGGQRGSLLFWSWILTGFTALVAFRNRQYAGKLVPYTLGILSITSAFFLIMNKFGANPFQQLVVDHGDGMQRVFTAKDGNGLNPLLQHPAMVIHPPMLYLGYVGFVVPFAFCMAALLTRELGAGWIKMARRWTLFAWIFLGTGILLGGRWAYVELGWGGYWAWDPVENASLMPWLTGTAFLHSVIVQERKNMLKVWNVSLILVTYLLAIFGTFLTRSGIVSSVHAFAQSSIGTYFLVFLIGISAFALYLVLTRLEFLKSDNQLDSYASREASFLFNNLVLLAACFAVFWGTLFPVFSELIQGEQVTVGAPFFNKINIPIAMFLLFLTGVGPLLAWRKTSWESMKHIFLWPVVIGVVTAIICIVGGIRSIYPVMSLSLSAFVLTTLVSEFNRGTRARMRNTGENAITALIGLVMTNKRRYGGYVTHLGFLLLIVGFTGQAFTTEGWGEVKQGDTFTIGKYDFACVSVQDISDPNYSGMSATLDVSSKGKKIARLSPEKRFYPASEQTTSEVRMHHTPLEDVYVVFANIKEDTEAAVIQVWINPLVSWVWLGGYVLVGGTIITLLPNRRERRIAKQKRSVEKLLEDAELVSK
ncbi:MAG TPA: heme lyase CcmF/NrfE family subunit [Candidatus Krumholzibacteria bacterium]|nr:heme lyase CcmF/NrfE family subunit [Candidatus Krumholzibacteria bacterium]